MKIRDMLKLVVLSGFPSFHFRLATIEVTEYSLYICSIKGSVKELAISLSV